MRIQRLIYTLDAPDLSAESGFWAALLGGEVETDDDWHSVVVDGELRLGVQLAPDHVPPVWPGGPQQQQAHLDVWVDDLAEGHQRVVALGGRMLQESQEPDSDEQFVVYADPAGHPFCLCWAAAAH